MNNNIFLIKDLSRLSGHSVYTLKYYLKLGLIKEISRSPETGFRYFNEETLNTLKKIRKLQLQGKTLKQIKSLI